MSTEEPHIGFCCKHSDLYSTSHSQLANSYSNTDRLQNLTAYYYKVVPAVDTSANIGILSDEGSGTTGDSTAPSKVLGLTVTPISGSQIDLGWTTNPEPDVAHYNVYRGTTAGFAVNTDY